MSYPAQGYYQGPPRPPPVMAPPYSQSIPGYYQGPPGYYQGPPGMAPQQHPAPPPRREPGFLEGCLAALCCCELINYCYGCGGPPPLAALCCCELINYCYGGGSPPPPTNVVVVEQQFYNPPPTNVVEAEQQCYN